jgi:hypothetical protein
MMQKIKLTSQKTVAKGQRVLASRPGFQVADGSVATNDPCRSGLLVFFGSGSSGGTLNAEVAAAAQVAATTEATPATTGTSDERLSIETCLPSTPSRLVDSDVVEQSLPQVLKLDRPLAFTP